MRYDFPYQPINSENTKLFAQVDGTGSWEEFSFEPISEDSVIGHLYKADLSQYDDIDSASINLRFYFEDMSGNTTQWELSPAFTVGKEPIITDVKEEPIVPVVYKLDQNYPNPFNPSTIISYSIPKSSKVTIKIYDILGREVATLLDKEQETGSYQLAFDANVVNGGLSSGIYFYQINAGNFNKTKKMMLIK